MTKIKEFCINNFYEIIASAFLFISSIFCFYNIFFGVLGIVCGSLLLYNRYGKITGDDFDDFEEQEDAKEAPANSGNFLELGTPFPYLVLNNKKIVEAGGFLKLGFTNGKISRIPDIIPNYDPQLKKQNAVYGNKTYTLYTKHFKTGTEVKDSEEYKDDYSAVFFVENAAAAETDGQKTERMLAGLIYIDNYDEATEGMDEARRPLLTALIDRKLNGLAQQVNGIVTKFEKDKYLFVFAADELEYLREKKFDILGQIREIDMGNKIPVTLSIGIGVNGTSIAQNMGFSRTAIDLALGRGGDQALIKDVDKYQFFGGVTKEGTVNARVRARVKTHAFTELIDDSDKVIVLGHKNIDLDCLGAAVGVYKIAEALGCECNIVLGEITSGIRYLHERLIENENYCNKVFISAEKAADKITRKTLIVVVDTYRQSIVEGGELLDLPLAKKIVIFDHHRKATEFIENAVLVYHEPYASSTSELITEMLQYVKANIKLSGVEADALLAGITVDTKNFAIKTGAKTFEAAAYLRRNGADSVRVKMLFQNDLASFKAKAAAVNSAEIINQSMAISISPSNVENPSLTAAQTADELLNIYGIKASFVLCYADEKVYISARSLSGTNVQVIMEKLGGGGHQTVAGAQINGKSIEDVEEMLKEAIDRYLHENQQNIQEE